MHEEGLNKLLHISPKKWAVNLNTILEREEENNCLEGAAISPRNKILEEQGGG